MATTEGYQDRRALILYGTETGNAQDIAEEVGRIVERLHFQTDVSELDEVPVENLTNNTFTVFVVSTTGQGDFPFNARRFWAFLLRKKLTATYLAGVNFTVVGVGDSSYPKFNFAARKLQKRLKQVGAQEICQPCEADEQDDEGINGAFLLWVQQFRVTVSDLFPLPENIKPISEDVSLPYKWRLELTYEEMSSSRDLQTVKTTSSEGNTAPLRRHQSSQAQAMQNGTSPPNRSVGPPENPPDLDERVVPGSYRATLTENRRLTPKSHWQDVRLLTLTIAEDLPYYPGDALAIVPKNASSDVSALIELMRWEPIADVLIEIAPKTSAAKVVSKSKPASTPSTISTNLTLRILLLNYLDILAIPRRSFFSHIAPFTTNELHRERLLEFTDPKHLDEYYDYATRPRRSILEILAEFDSVQIPWQEAINVFPRLRPRQFSIASGGSLKHLPINGSERKGTRFELLVAIVRYQTVIRKIREGVCTRYLASLGPGSTVNIVLRSEGRFHRLPHQHRGLTGPHVLIGTGTGLAPIRALIHEKKFWALQGHHVGPTTLFFGCRSPDADFFFQDEDFSPINSRNCYFGHDFVVFTAFSRAQKRTIYVQDRVRQEADLVCESIHQNATVVICGSSGSMPKAVKEALGDVLAKKNLESGHETSQTENAARKYVEEMEKSGRLREETW